MIRGSSRCLACQPEAKQHSRLIWGAYQSYLHEENRYTLRDLCYTANTGRGHYACRAAVLCSSREELGQKLAQLQESLHSGGMPTGEIAPGVFYGCHRMISSRKEKKKPAI
ncbi:hypothetical protein ACFTAO_28965 [Paenibacillus rhizoplanae]